MPFAPLLLQPGEWILTSPQHARRRRLTVVLPPQQPKRLGRGNHGLNRDDLRLSPIPSPYYCCLLLRRSPNVVTPSTERNRADEVPL